MSAQAHHTVRRVVFEAYIREGKDLTVKEIASRGQIAESTVRRLLCEQEGIEERAERRTSRSSNYPSMTKGSHNVSVYGPTRKALGEMLAQHEVSTERCTRCERALRAGQACVPCSIDGALRRDPLATRARDVTWDATTRNERFAFQLGEWSVTAAKLILATSPREAVLVDVAPLAGLAALVDEHAKRMDVDLNFPLIVGTIAVARGGLRPTPLVIDGWARVRAALAAGVGQLRAFVLTEGETSGVRLA